MRAAHERIRYVFATTNQDESVAGSHRVQAWNKAEGWLSGQPFSFAPPRFGRLESRRTGRPQCVSEPRRQPQKGREWRSPPKRCLVGVWRGSADGTYHSGSRETVSGSTTPRQTRRETGDYLFYTNPGSWVGPFPALVLTPPV